ncbi:MAG TPA: S-methyl-5-thioribose-1-phosphate isomerase [Spirochaetia bacterium]|nr:S-methyl-5-thioribose-1-phosphate isomerase [Spirochaetia bacterium]
MNIDGKHYRTIQRTDDLRAVQIIDQRYLPFEVRFERIDSWRGMVAAIHDMHLRGAPLIGAAAGFGVWLACEEYRDLPPAQFAESVATAAEALAAARPTAVNLRWALRRVSEAMRTSSDPLEQTRAASVEAQRIAEEDVEVCAALGRTGVRLLQAIHGKNPDRPVQILTHCNAGWLATVDYGTVTAVIYEASRVGVPVHVWVDETRPRVQGGLTSWELSENGIDNTVICDNAGGHVMQQGLVDLVLVGTDRTAGNGDVANKIGTYLKALAARDNNLPFYVALPSSSFDPSIATGVGGIPIEERDPDEVLTVRGMSEGSWSRVALYAPSTHAANYAFDVTPARLVSGYITERGIFSAHELKDAIGSTQR